MKRNILLISILSLVLFSCKKNCIEYAASETLDGKWRMITVKENSSGSITTKPVSIMGDVDITFTSTSVTNGTFRGVTPTNEIWINDYTVGASQTISIPSLSMTKVGETSWGNAFVDNITSAKNYNFESDGKLNITTNLKTLVFRRL